MSHDVNLKLKANFLFQLRKCYKQKDLSPKAIAIATAGNVATPDMPQISGAAQSPVIAMVKVVDTESGESKLVLNDEAVAIIRDIKGPISVIAIAGAYR